MKKKKGGPLSGTAQVESRATSGLVSSGAVVRPTSLQRHYERTAANLGGGRRFHLQTIPPKRDLSCALVRNYENASSQLPRVEALEYSVARFSKKLVCSMALSIWSIHGSGFFASLR